MLTNEEAAKVCAALTACNGDRGLAAERLNMSRNELSAIIRNSTELQTLFKLPVGGPKGTKLKRHPGNGGIITLPAVVETEEQQAVRHEGEFQKVLAEVNHDMDQATAVALQKMGGRYIEQTYALIMGTVAEQVQGVRKVLNVLRPEVLSDIAENKLDEKFVQKRILYTDGTKVLLAMAEKVGQSLVVGAKVKALKEASKGKKYGKVGFGPKQQTNIMAQNVQVRS